MPKKEEEINLTENSSFMISIMYALLSEENKKIVNQQIDYLRAAQSNCQ